MPQPRIGELLVSAGVLRPEQLALALEIPRDGTKRFGEMLVERGFVTDTQLTQALGQQLAVPWVSLGHVEFSRQLLSLVPAEVAARYLLLPVYVRRIRKQGDTLYVAMEDPTNEMALSEVERVTGMPTRPMIASPVDLRAAIRLYYGEGSPEAPPTRPPSIEPPKPAAPLPTPEPPRAKPPVPDAKTVEAAPLLDDSEVVVADSEPPPPPAPHDDAVLPLIAPAPTPSPALRGGIPSELPTEPRALIPPPEAIPPRTQEAAPEAPPKTVTTPRVLVPPPDLITTDPPDDEPDEPPTVLEPPVHRGLARVEPEPHSRRTGPSMVSLTLLDGTTIQLPAPAPSAPPSSPKLPVAPADGGDDGQEPEANVTARDILRALRAAAQGKESEIFGHGPRWEPVAAALLAVLLRSGTFAEWEFAEEYRRIASVPRRDEKK